VCGRCRVGDLDHRVDEGAAAEIVAGEAFRERCEDGERARGQVVDKKARPLAISLPSRSPLYPDVPTLAETFPGFTTSGFLAIAVPKATPLPIQQRLNTLINEAIFSDGINKRLTDEFALTPRRLDLAQCAEQDREERAKWADYVKIAKIEPQ